MAISHVSHGDLYETEQLLAAANERLRREVNRRIKVEQELDALRSAAKQVWDDLMITHEIGPIKDVAEESVERLGSVLFVKPKP